MYIFFRFVYIPLYLLQLTPLHAFLCVCFFPFCFKVIIFKTFPFLSPDSFSFRVPREAASVSVEILDCAVAGCPLTLALNSGLAGFVGNARQRLIRSELVEAEAGQNVSCLPNGPACALTVS